MRRKSWCVAALSLLLCSATFAQDAKPSLSAEPQGMVQLFNGKDLTGWDGDPKLWSVKDGVIRGETTKEVPAQGNTFIIWKGGTVKDFDLRVQFRLNAANNSGIQYRSKHITEGNPRNKWIVRGYQGEVRNEVKLPSVSGFIYDEGGGRGRMCNVGEKVVWEDKKNVTGTICTQEDFTKAFKLDEWNEYTIIARGNNIKQYINGLQTADFTDKDAQKALSEGIIALQLHAGAPMWVEFRNIRLKQY